VRPTEAALQCTMCGTRVGLWTFFGDGRMPVLQNAVSSTMPQAMHSTSTFSSIAVNNQVAVNLKTTIAGGLLHGSRFGEVPGPFGSPQAAAGAFSSGSAQGTGSTSTRDEKAAAGGATGGQRQPKDARDGRDSWSRGSYKASCRSSFDPLEAHKAFCPWSHTVTKDNDECSEECSKPGWHVYLDCLHNAA
jgi:hypothetical protein